MALGFIKKVFSFGRKEVEDRPAGEDAPATVTAAEPPAETASDALPETAPPFAAPGPDAAPEETVPDDDVAKDETEGVPPPAETPPAAAAEPV